ncbi:MAG: cell division protein FtsZ, partial [Methylothermaceae bacterium]|nr:cell division protein FtsZ [Methylothermaceae bacterium]
GTGSASGENRAREAAERAIASPLLEDVNLHGARGILVNITGGLDLSIGEFDVVGNTVKEFSSDDAVVVVGTVIDPELQDEIRVTVVATGLAGSAGAAVEEPPVRLVEKDSDGKVDYDKLERPTVIRQQPDRVRKLNVPSGSNSGVNNSEEDLDYLDIPAFLRRQAD